MVAKSKSEPDRTDLNLATRAAWLSYIGGYTQGEIANRLYVSPAKAHRLIALAHQRNLVKVFIEGEPAECVALEEELIRRFGLRACIVAPSVEGGDNAEIPGEFAAVGAAAARFLYRTLGGLGPALIGVGKGRSLAAMIERMPAMDRADLQFVSVSGSLTRNLSANPYDVVHRMVERTGGEGYFLPVPYIAADSREKEVLLSQKSVCDLLDLARRAELFIVGIGAMEGDAHVRQVGMVTEAEWITLRQSGAVGDIMGSFIEIDGRPVECDVNTHTLGLTIEDLRERRVIAVAGGANKARAILGALRTGIISDLILSETAAKGIVAILEEGGEGDNDGDR